MLKPAILYKNKILELFAKELYTEDYFYYNGYDCGSCLPTIEPREDVYTYACVDKSDNVIGYLTYRIYSLTDTVCDFGLYSFDKGNPILGVDVLRKLKELISKYHKVEWRVIEGNPVKRHYDKFCKKYNGNIIHLHDTSKDLDGRFRDSFIYEIIRDRRYYK